MINANRFVIVSSSNATKLQKDDSSERMQKKIYDPLMKYERPILDLVQPSESELSDTIEPDDLIISCGGDGTLNWLANSAIRLAMHEKITLLPQPFGGMNDISSTIYGHRSIDNIIDRGSVATAYTIEATHYMDNQTQETINALGYIGLGASGVAALAVNYNEEHSKQKMSDVLSAARAVAETTKSFVYKDQGGEITKAYELLAMKTRMAGFVKPPYPLLFEEAFYFIKPRSRISAIGQLSLGLVSMAGHGSVQTRDRILSITPEQHIMMQADGEHRLIKTNETVVIKNGQPVSLVRAGK